MDNFKQARLPFAFWTVARLFLFVGFCALCLSLVIKPVQSNAPQVSYDGLELVRDDKSGVSYFDPRADFSVYTRYIMLEPYVALKKNWERDTRVAGRRVPKKYVEELKVVAANLLQEVFREELGADGGFPLASAADDDVLLIRPAIINLDVTAPDVPMAGRVQTYTSSSLDATLYLEFFDSVSGAILGRVIDRQVIRDKGYASWTTSVSNRADAKRIYKRWAQWLRESWDEVHTEKKSG